MHEPFTIFEVRGSSKITVIVARKITLVPYLGRKPLKDALVLASNVSPATSPRIRCDKQHHSEATAKLTSRYIEHSDIYVWLLLTDWFLWLKSHSYVEKSAAQCGRRASSSEPANHQDPTQA